VNVFANIVDFSDYVWLVLGTTVLSMLLTRQFVSLAVHKSWTVEPNERSSHSDDKPFGGGGVVISVALAAWLIFGKPTDPVGLGVLAATIGLAIISWIDDLKMVHFGLRLSLQVIAVSLVLWLLPADQRILSDDWPLLMERVITGFGWIWLINLYNFMDGIDGLAATETIAICIGLAIVGMIIGLPTNLLILAVVLGGATLGFLPWNWHRSKIMLGDLGSIPIGFLLGFLLLNLAIRGYVLAALILPLYFVTDASITLVRRMLERKKFWQPHREHFYQRTVQAGLTHDQVVLKVIVTNIILICTAFWSISQPLWAALLAFAAVAFLMIHFHLLSKG